LTQARRRSSYQHFRKNYLKSPFSHVTDGPRHDLVHPRSIFGKIS
ncbi:hypothetical protein T11_629, partial [Trichinella zimbabwensis]